MNSIGGVLNPRLHWKVAAVVFLATAAVTLLYAYLPRIRCDNLPEFHVVVDGTAVTRDISGYGVACGAIGDGVGIDALDPIPVKPGSVVLIEYETPVAWPELTYTVSQDGQVRVQRRLRRHLAFTLPEQPGLYHVSIAYRWEPWPAGLRLWLDRLGIDASRLYLGDAQGAKYFRVRVSP